MSVWQPIDWHSSFWTLIAAVAVPVVLWIVATAYSRARLLNRIPRPSRHWLLGNWAQQSAPDHHKWLLSVTERLGGVWSMRILHQHFVVVTEPAAASEVLRNTQDYEKALQIYHIFDGVVSKAEHATIFSSAGDEYWRMVRKAYAPAFQINNIRNGFHHELRVSAEAAEVLNAIGPDRPVEVHSLMERVALEATGKVGFDKDFGVVKAAHPQHQAAGRGNDYNALSVVNDAILEGERRFLNPLRRPLRLVWPGVRAGERACAQFQQAMADLRDELKARGEEWLAKDTSIAAHVMRIRDKDGRRLPDDRLAAEIATLFVAAELTTADTISWTMFLIAQHPEVEAKIVAELHELGLLVGPDGQPERTMTYDDLNRLTYLSCAIKEAMRMLPSASNGSFRITKRAVKLGGYDVPKGVIAWVPFYSMHNSSHNFPDADKFLPERWLNGSSSERDQEDSADAKGSKPVAYMPFSVGPRNCIGQSMGKMTYTTTLALLYSRFTFRLAQEGGAAAVYAQQHMNLTLQPSKGIHMLCIPRVQQA